MGHILWPSADPYPQGGLRVTRHFTRLQVVLYSLHTRLQHFKSLQHFHHHSLDEIILSLHFWPFFFKSHISDQDITVLSRPILHLSLRSFRRSILLVNSFISSSYAPTFVQRFRRYGILVMETTSFCFRAISQDPLHIILSFFDAEHYSIIPFQRAQDRPNRTLRCREPASPSYSSSHSAVAVCTRKSTSYLSQFCIVFYHLTLVLHLPFKLFLVALLITDTYSSY
jgi:hypothetical protein